MAVNSGAGGNIDPSFIREAEELKRRRAAGGPLNPLQNGVRAGIETAMKMPLGTINAIDSATMPFVRGTEQGIQASTGLPVNTINEAIRGTMAPPSVAPAQAQAPAAAPGGGVRPLPVPPSIAQRQEAMRARQLAQGLRMQHRDALRSGASYADLDPIRRRIDEAENAAMGLQLAPPMQSPQTPEQVAAGRARLNEQATELAKLPPDQAGPNPQVNIKFDPYNLAEAGARVERNQQVYAQNKAVGDDALLGKMNAEGEREGGLRARIAEQERLRKLPQQLAMEQGGLELDRMQKERKMLGAVPDDLVAQQARAEMEAKLAQSRAQGAQAMGDAAVAGRAGAMKQAGYDEGRVVQMSDALLSSTGSRFRNGYLGTSMFGPTLDKVNADLSNFEASVMLPLQRLAKLDPQAASEQAAFLLSGLPSPTADGTYKNDFLTGVIESGDERRRVYLAKINRIRQTLTALSGEQQTAASSVPTEPQPQP